MNSSSSFGRTGQRERLLDHHRLADRRSPPASSSASSTFPFLGYRWTLMKSRSSATLAGTKPEVRPGPIQAPVHQAHGNQVPLVLLPDGGGQVLHPLAGDVGPGPVCLVQRDELDEMLPGEGRRPANRRPCVCRPARPARSSGRSRRRRGCPCTRPATACQKRACTSQRSFSESLSYQAGTSFLW